MSDNETYPTALAPLMRRAILFACCLLSVFVCGWGWIENSWASGFEGPHRAAFEFRAHLFFWLLLASVTATVLTAWKWIGLAVRGAYHRIRVNRRKE